MHSVHTVHEYNTQFYRPNKCNVSVSEQLLKRAERYQELVMLYKNRGLHRRALELLYKHGGCTFMCHVLPCTHVQLPMVLPESILCFRLGTVTCAAARMTACVV